ncbi:MAG: SCO family protein [Calditrichaceae bacterium]|nr:SCO family protein [Calditrichaceae bacterium]
MNYKYQNKSSVILLISMLILVSAAYIQAQIANQNPDELQNINVEEHLGQTIPVDLQFTNEQGENILLQRYFNQSKPVILVLAYYECPMLCTLVLNGLTQSVYKLNMLLGEDYQIVTVSIDPTETKELAAAKKQSHLKMLNQPENPHGWVFLTGTEGNINKLTESVGFKYYYVEERDEYAHPAVVMLLSETGKITRYLYGIEYKTNDLKLGLLEAAEGKVGSTLDKLILYCYHYDPNAKGYVIFASNVMKLGGAVTLLLLSAFIGLLWVKDKSRNKIGTK